MMSYSIFISCVHEDAAYIINLKSWAKNGLLGNGVVITHEKEDMRVQGYDTIRNHIRKKIEGASAVLVIIGNDTHNHDWIRAEVELANSFNKRLVISRLPDSKGGLPPILSNKTITLFDANSIKKSLGL